MVAAEQTHVRLYRLVPTTFAAPLSGCHASRSAGAATRSKQAPPPARRLPQVPRRRRRGRASIALSGVHAAALEEYVQALAAAQLAAQTRRTYGSKARQYLAWLAGADVDGDPLWGAEGRDWAVRDYRSHLQAVLKRAPATVNNALAAVDDLYIRRGLGPAQAKRLEIPDQAPRALDQRAQIRFLRAVQACPSPRDRALALVPFYAGARISETVALDLEDLRLSARGALLRIYGKGERVREVPIHPKLREAPGELAAIALGPQGFRSPLSTRSNAAEFARAWEEPCPKPHRPPPAPGSARGRPRDLRSGPRLWPAPG